MDLPRDLIYEIMLNITLADLMNVRQVCKQFYALCSNEQYWRRRMERDYPHVNKPHEAMTHRKYHQSLGQARSFLQSLEKLDVDDVITVVKVDDYAKLFREDYHMLYLIYPVPSFHIWQNGYDNDDGFGYHLLFDVYMERLNYEWSPWKRLSKGTDVILVTYQTRQPGGRNLPRIGAHLAPINVVDYFSEADRKIFEECVIDPNSPSSRYQFFPFAAVKLLVQDVIKQGYLGRDDFYRRIDAKIVHGHPELFETACLI